MKKLRKFKCNSLLYKKVKHLDNLLYDYEYNKRKKDFSLISDIFLTRIEIDGILSDNSYNSYNDIHFFNNYFKYDSKYDKSLFIDIKELNKFLLDHRCAVSKKFINDYFRSHDVYIEPEIDEGYYTCDIDNDLCMQYMSEKDYPRFYENLYKNKRLRKRQLSYLV